MTEITDKPIDPQSVFDRLQKNSSGSIVIHYAIVKEVEGGKKSQSLEFKVNGDIEGEINELEKNLRGKWPVEDVFLIRRIGALSVGDVISIAAASAEHRDAAFGLCQEAVDCFKKMKHIQKDEIFEDSGETS